MSTTDLYLMMIVDAALIAELARQIRCGQREVGNYVVAVLSCLILVALIVMVVIW